MAVRAILWDLDGTLLDTLGDLAASVNAALKKEHMPERTLEEVRSFVGNGVKVLMERAVPQDASPEEKERALSAFLAHYAQHSNDTTCPYPGVMEALDALALRGVKMGVVSNKVDFAVRQLCELYFGSRMQVTVGDDPSRRRKPAPDSLLAAMKLLGVSAEETVYVGDSDVDVETARNAGVRCIAVSWGFRSRECLEAAGAAHIAGSAQELLDRISELEKTDKEDTIC